MLQNNWYANSINSNRIFDNLSKNALPYKINVVDLWHQRVRIMKLKATIIVMLFFLGVNISHADSQSFVYNGQEVNKTDAADKKQGHWVYFGKHKNLPGYAPEDPVEEGDFVDNRKTGIWISYYPGSKKKSEIEHKGGRPNGTFVKYYENGVVEEKGNWLGNRYVGSLERRYENGNLAQQKVFNESGKEDGPQKFFHENGKVEFEFNKKNGVEAGPAKRFYENGDLKEELNYTDGQVTARTEKPMVNPPYKATPKAGDNKTPPAMTGTGNPGTGKVLKDGYNKTYNANQDLEMDGEFKDGKLWNGKWYKYDKNGLILKIEIYKNGKYVGDGVLEF